MKRARFFYSKVWRSKTRQAFCLSVLLCLVFCFCFAIFLTGCESNHNSGDSSSSLPTSDNTLSSQSASPTTSSEVSSDEVTGDVPGFNSTSSKQIVNIYGDEILAPITFLILDNRDMPLVNARVQIEDFPYSGVTTYEGKVVFSHSPDTGSTPLCEGEYTMRIEQDTLSDEPQVDILQFTLNQKSPDFGVTLHTEGERTHDLLLASTIRIEFLAAYTSGPPAKNLQVVLKCKGNCLGEDEEERYYRGFTDEIGRVAFVGVDSAHRYSLSFLWYGGNPITLTYTTANEITGDVDMTLADDGWYVGAVPMTDLKISQEELKDIVKVKVSIRQKEK